MHNPDDRICIREIRAQAFIGATESERAIAQEILVDIEVGLDCSGARSADRMSGTIDYARLHAAVLAIISASRCVTLEHLAEQILARAVESDAAIRASIGIAKPALLKGATPSVVITGRKRTRVAIGLGANLGDPQATLAQALVELSRLGKVTHVSSLYRTKPYGVTDQPDFFNAAALLETTRLPHGILAVLKHIERELGRTPGVRYGPRVIDLDVLHDDGAVLSDAELTLPHPRLIERAFVLAPLAEIDDRFEALFHNLPADRKSSVTRLAEWPSRDANRNPS